MVQLCHPDLHNDFPPLRTANAVAAKHLPMQLTSFIGRQAEMKGIREALADNRLVTLTGAGGAGKTRLAVQIAATMAPNSPTGFGTSTWHRSPIPRWFRSRWHARWACPTNPVNRRWTYCCGSFAIAGC